MWSYQEPHFDFRSSTTRKTTCETNLRVEDQQFFCVHIVSYPALKVRLCRNCAGVSDEPAYRWAMCLSPSSTPAALKACEPKDLTFNAQPRLRLA
jgi:hypothetical protein